MRYARFCTASLYRSTSTSKAFCSPASTSSTSSTSFNASTIAPCAFSLDELFTPTATWLPMDLFLLEIPSDVSAPLDCLRRVLLAGFARAPITPNVPDACSADSIIFTACYLFLLCIDRKSTRLNSSHGYISYAVFCLKKNSRYYRSGDRAGCHNPRSDLEY